MLDPTETKLTATQACRHPLLRRGDHPLNRSVLERWWTLGIRPARGGERVILESQRLGGLRFTSVEAIERFLARINGEDTNPSSKARELQRDHQRADRELAAAGM